MSQEEIDISVVMLTYFHENYIAQALDSVLFAYNGRAIVDSRSLLPEERLEEIARRYGAVVI